MNARPRTSLSQSCCSRVEADTRHSWTPQVVEGDSGGGVWRRWSRRAGRRCAVECGLPEKKGKELGGRGFSYGEGLDGASATLQLPPAAGPSKHTPQDFLNSVIGRPVIVKLNSGVDYRGALLLGSSVVVVVGCSTVDRQRETYCQFTPFMTRCAHDRS